MRARGPLVLLVFVAGAAGWMLLDGRDDPVEPDLGPVVQVRLDPSPTAPPTAVPSSRPGAPGDSRRPGAQAVPRHLPAPAGDDEDDGDDGDDGDDDGDTDRDTDGVGDDLDDGADGPDTDD